MRSWLTEDVIIDNQADLQSKFDTAGLKHNVVTGLTLSSEQNERRTRVAENSQTTLLNPNPNDIYEGEIIESPIVGDVTGKSFALYAFDTVELNQKWELNGGLRYDYFDVDGTTTLGLPVARLDKMLSWRAGSVFKPAEKFSLYAAAGTSLNPSLEGLSYQTANTAIEPEKTFTYEAGGKFELLDSRLSINGAIFRVDKTNARTPGLTPDEPPQVLEGRQRVDGLEFSVSGTIIRHWEIFGGYTYLDSEILESNNPLEVGRNLQNTPKHSLSFWSTYEFPHGISLGGGPRYVSKRFGNNINTRFVDGYWLLDLMASYPLTHFMDLRLNIYNVTDEYYFDRLGGGHLIPGAARSAMVSVGFSK
jgi:catecholate siderophore receptor